MTLLDRQKELAGHLTGGFPELGLRGWDLAGACAGVGNSTQENLCKPVTLGRKDAGSDGAFQHRNDHGLPPPNPGRLTELQEWCTTHFGAWDNLRAQAAFVLFETKRDYPALHDEMCKSMDGVKPKDVRKVLDFKTAEFCWKFERPKKGPTAGLLNRQRHAASVYQIMSGKPSSPIPPVIKAGGGVISAGGAAGGAVLAQQSGLSDPVALALIIGAIVVAAALAYFMQRQKKAADAASIVRPAPERLAEALDSLSISQAKVAEIADELRDEIEDAKRLLVMTEPEPKEQQP